MSAATVSMTAMGTLSTVGSAAAAPQSQVHVTTYESTAKTPPVSLNGPNGEVPTEWGMVSIPAGVSASDVITLKESKSGGEWTYGTTEDGIYKGCYSNYIHTTKKHSASVSIATNTDKDIQNADIWAKAYAKSGYGYTCYAYWGVY